MKYRDIAKRFIFDRGAVAEISAEDGINYNPSKRAFTDGQLTKVNEARTTVADSLKAKWKLEPAKKRRG